ncbi:hypothetical protein BDF19DRAFT_429836 [Syncephalis fuscata]|nr:hypothetical protein BDF19DRAFT_429836 [Syncephalis fuscata]
MADPTMAASTTAVTTSPSSPSIEATAVINENVTRSEQQENTTIIISETANNHTVLNEKTNDYYTNPEMTDDTEAVLPPPSTAPNPPAGDGGNGRLVSLDVLRGFTVCLMILVNYQIEDEAFSYLLHPEWLGFSIADSVFPNFLFVMGLAVPLAGRRLKGTGMQVAVRIMKRSSLLILLGMFITNFPFTTPNIASHWRPAGVLQRLGIAYAVCAGAFAWLRPDIPPTTEEPEDCDGETQGAVKTMLHRTKRAQRHLAFNTIFPATALAIWLGLTFGVNVPGCGRGHFDMECSVESYFDSHIFGPEHNYQGKSFDPEGSLSHVTAVLSCYLGVRVGIQVMGARTALRSSFGQLQHISSWSLLSAGFALIAYLFNPVIPISKPLWTPTFTLFAGSISLMELATMTYVVDYVRLSESASAIVAKPTKLFLNACLAVGKNPLAIYMASELIAASVMSIPIAPGANGEERSLWSVTFQYVFASWLPMRLNSLVWSGVWVSLLYVPMAMLMDSRGWYLKI